MIFLKAPAVAALCGYRSPSTFKDHLPRLQRDHGFPPPMPTQRRPQLWRADQVHAWLQTQGRPGAQPAPPPPGTARLMQIAGRG